ncbi:MAG: hypothetical protein GX303_06925 [Clostridiales bacterium]|nr:hypothetical protein [Clostridiales bacterium]
MKKTLLLLSLVLVIAVSIISGTLAMYTTTIDELAVGSVVAKEFILLEDGTDTFVYNEPIAPSETKTWSFAVKNNNGTVTSETGMDLAFTIEVGAANGKAVIEPLRITVVDDETGMTVGTVEGAGTMAYANEFSAGVAESRSYTVVIEWPSNDAVDIDYAGAGFGTAVKVSVTGTQK